MRVYLLNFASGPEDGGFKNLLSQQRIQNESARKFGIQNIVSHRRSDLLKTDFYREHQYLLDRQPAGGHGLWKPYYILELFKQIDEGDIVFYLDADIGFIGDPQPLFDICVQNNGIFLIALRESDRKNRYHVKRDCFHFMECDTVYFHDGPHTPSGFQMYQKNARAVAFVEELLHYMVQRPIISREPSICGKPELDGFILHRTDQAVLSLLRLKHGIEGFRWPSEWGNHYKMPEYRVLGEFTKLGGAYDPDPYMNSPYGTILADLTRSPEPSSRKGFLGKLLNSLSI
jgi:hypothetical protein